MLKLGDVLNLLCSESKSKSNFLYKMYIIYSFCLFKKVFKNSQDFARKRRLFLTPSGFKLKLGRPKFVFEVWAYTTLAGLAVDQVESSKMCQSWGITQPPTKSKTLYYILELFGGKSVAERKVEQQVKVLIKNFAIFFLFPSKQFLPISLKIQLLVILCNI
jgi:hypothetical protein